MDDAVNTHLYGYHGSRTNDVYNATRFPERRYAQTGVEGYNRALAGEIAHVRGQSARPFGESFDRWIDQRDRVREAARTGGDQPHRTLESDAKSHAVSESGAPPKGHSTAALSSSLRRRNLGNAVVTVENARRYDGERHGDVAAFGYGMSPIAMTSHPSHVIDVDSRHALKASIRHEVNAALARHVSSRAMESVPAHGHRGIKRRY
jgi:hypothetical protein